MITETCRIQWQIDVRMLEDEISILKSRFEQLEESKVKEGDLS